MASGFTLVEWEGRRPRAVNEIEIKICNMAEKLNPSPTVGEFVHQPMAFKFPVRDFGKKKRSFQLQW